MIKNLLFIFIVFNFCSVNMFGQTAELTNLQYDATVEQGQTSLTFTFDYTASEAGSVEWQLITAAADGSPAWGEYNFAYMVLAVDSAATPTTLSFTYDVPTDANLTTYTWTGKVTLDGMDLGYNNTGNLVQVIENGGTTVDPVGELSNLVFDSVAVQGQTGLTFTFDYIANQAGAIEWQLITANPDGSPAWGSYYFSLVSIAIDSVDTPTTLSFTYDIPADADLTDYTWAGKITLNGMDLGYNNQGNSVAVTLVSNVEEAFKSSNTFDFFPNPVTNQLHIKSENQNAKFKIYNHLGQLVLVDNQISSERNIDVSNLLDGVYLIKSNDGSISKMIKN